MPDSAVGKPALSTARDLPGGNLGDRVMPRPATGQVIHPTASHPSFALRFRAYGKREYLTLGRPEDGWTQPKAERELAAVLREVERRTWRHPEPRPAPTPEPRPTPAPGPRPAPTPGPRPASEPRPAPAPATAPAVDPTFHEFASDWFAAKRVEIQPNTASSYRNDLTNHLLPFFKDHRLSQITIPEVDRYRHTKVREAAEIATATKAGKPPMVEIVDRRGRRYHQAERPLSPRSINMHISLLAQILEVAVDHKHLQRNPATGRRRHLKTHKPRPAHLDSAEHITVLLDAAGELDKSTRTTGRRAAIALLLLAGPRASAGGALLWRDVDLANGRINFGRDKTDAGMREVDMLGLLREILAEHKAASEKTGPDEPVFVTSNGKARDRHNLRQLLAPVIARAEQMLAERGGQPLLAGITPHKLRHTFASILVAIGKDPTYVMNQLGHTDPAFTLRVYAHMMRRSNGERERLRALVER